jgi:hypothetical protein
MIIALDYDDTYTADVEFWQQYITLARDHGHRVLCVTSRDPSPGNKATVLPCDSNGFGIPVYFTNQCAKRWYMETVWKTEVDVWIDDLPERIGNGV